jgi:hypothetical protein
MSASVAPAETGIQGSAVSALDPSVDREVVFTARGITKVYQMGEVEVQALRGVDFDVSSREFVVPLAVSRGRTRRATDGAAKAALSAPRLQNCPWKPRRAR